MVIKHNHCSFNFEKAKNSPALDATLRGRVVLGVELAAQVLGQTLDMLLILTIKLVCKKRAENIHITGHNSGTFLMDTLGTQRFVLCREVVPFQVILYGVYTRVLLACPLLGGLSSFRVSFIGGFTVRTYFQ